MPKKSAAPDRSVVSDQVYIMNAAGAYKVGVSKNPTSRVRQLQTGNPDTIELVHAVTACGIDAYKAEACIHDFLKERGQHLRGEWFQLSISDLSQLKTIMNKSIAGKAPAPIPEQALAELTADDLAALLPSPPSNIPVPQEVEL